VVRAETLRTRAHASTHTHTTLVKQRPHSWTQQSKRRGQSVQWVALNPSGTRNLASFMYVKPVLSCVVRVVCVGDMDGAQLLLSGHEMVLVYKTVC
jgi:hypothetical protein